MDSAPENEDHSVEAEVLPEVMSSAEQERRQMIIKKSVAVRLNEFFATTDAHEHFKATEADVSVACNGNEKYTVSISCFVCKKSMNLCSDAKSNASLYNFKRHFTKSHVVACKVVFKTDQQTITKFFTRTAPTAPANEGATQALSEPEAPLVSEDPTHSGN